MLGKRTRPVNAKFHEPAITIEKTMSSDVNTSPKSPLDMKIRSPRGLKNCNMGGGVGLGIVAELEKSCGSQVPVKFILGSLNLTRSDPIPIGSAKPLASTKCVGSIKVSNVGCWDDYTCVTSHGPNKSCTRMYFDGGENMVTSKGNFDQSWTKPVAFHPSPHPTRFVQEFPTSNFLSSCYLCRKDLHGKDIYMYRGEKAFCSTECRYRQIVSDERNEKCRSEASRSMDISVSPYSGGQLFSTGIFAV